MIPSVRPPPASRTAGTAITAVVLLPALVILSGPPSAGSGLPAGTEAAVSGPVTVRHAPQDRAAAREVARRAAELHRRVREEFGLLREVPVTVVLLTENLRRAGHEDFDGDLAPWIAGAAWSGRDLIVLRLRPGESSVDTDRVLLHELTHVILERDYPLLPSWPLWFREGLAMRMSGEEGLRGRASLSLAALRRRLIPLDSLWTSFPDDESGARLAYAESFSVISFLIAEHGRGEFLELMDRLRTEDFDKAFRSAYGHGPGKMESEWRRFVARRYSWVPLVTGGSAFWALTMAVFFLTAALRRRRNRLIERRWEEEGDGLR